MPPLEDLEFLPQPLVVETGVYRTNTRRNQNFDQIGYLAHDPRFPGPLAHRRAGFEKGGFDYGVFDFVGLIARALSTESMADSSPVEAKNYQRELMPLMVFATGQSTTDLSATAWP